MQTDPKQGIFIDAKRLCALANLDAKQILFVTMTNPVCQLANTDIIQRFFSQLLCDRNQSLFCTLGSGPCSSNRENGRRFRTSSASVGSSR